MYGAVDLPMTISAACWSARCREYVLSVMAGLGPAIHVFVSVRQSWMPGTSPGMTTSTKAVDGFPYARKCRCSSARDSRPAAAGLEILGHERCGASSSSPRCSSASLLSSATLCCGRPVLRCRRSDRVVGSGLTISLSVIMGLPAVLLATWIAIRPTRIPFADYLALRWTSWRNFFSASRAGHACRRLGPAVAGARARGRRRASWATC